MIILFTVSAFCLGDITRVIGFGSGLCLRCHCYKITKDSCGCTNISRSGNFFCIKYNL